MNYVLIVVSFVMTSCYMRGDQKSTQVSMQEFGSVELCRAAASEIARQNNGYGELRMSCVPKGTAK